MSTPFNLYEAAIPEADLGRESTRASEKSAIEALLDTLQTHERAERELLDDYSNAAAQLPDRGVRFLMGLILEDEARHHRLMAAMAEDIRSSVEWMGKDAVPSIHADHEVRSGLLASTDRFLAVERESADDLKELKKAVKHIGGGMLEVLVEGMEADTEKHIGMLKYIRDRLRKAD